MLCEACKARGKTWQGADPVCAFASGEKWSSNNWNCATTVRLRLIFEAPNRFRQGVLYFWRNDQNVGVLCAQDLEVEGDPISLWVSWYKHRGGTDQMWLMFSDRDPRRPTESELVRLIERYESLEEIV